MVKLFGTSGIRGIYGDKINEELARHLGNTLGRTKKNIMIGHDQRSSSVSLLKSFVEGAITAGANITIGGLACSPTCAYVARDYDVAITITASHNPPEYNGFKFWNSDGSGFSVLQEREIEREVGKYSGCGGGKIQEKSFAQSHIDAILRTVGKSSLKVVVDCNHGTASTITPKVISQMGCDVILLNENPLPDYAPVKYSDKRIGDWNKVAGIGELVETVKKTDADMGIVHDGDADRVFAVARGGRLITGDELLALFVGQTKGDIVTVVDGSMIVDKMASGKVIKVPVGDVYVSNGVKENSAVLGGEACSGTFIWPKHDFAPDGPMSAAKLVDLAGKCDLNDLLDKFPKFPLWRESVPCPHGMKHLIMENAARESKNLDCKVIGIDGVRCEFEKGWFLIRPSGTTPLIRLTVEAESEKELKHLKKIAKNIIEV